MTLKMSFMAVSPITALYKALQQAVQSVLESDQLASATQQMSS